MQGQLKWDNNLWISFLHDELGVPIIWNIHSNKHFWKYIFQINYTDNHMSQQGNTSFRLILASSTVIKSISNIVISSGFLHGSYSNKLTTSSWGVSYFKVAEFFLNDNIFFLISKYFGKYLGAFGNLVLFVTSSINMSVDTSTPPFLSSSTTFLSWFSFDSFFSSLS